MAQKLQTSFVQVDRLLSFADQLDFAANEVRMHAREIAASRESGVWMFGEYSMREAEIRLRTLEGELADAVRELKNGHPYDEHALKSRRPADAHRAEIQRRREAYAARKSPATRKVAEPATRYGTKKPKVKPTPINKGKRK
jgi:hypothetical protein